MTDIYIDPLDLWDLAKTKDELSELLDKLSILQESLFKTKASLNKKLDNNLTPAQREKILLLCERNKIDPKNLSDFDKLLSKTRETAENIPAVNLHIAFDPSVAFLDEVYEWFRTKVKQPVTVDIEVDPKIIAGAVIISKGIYADLSIKKKIDLLIENGQLKIDSVSQ